MTNTPKYVLENTRVSAAEFLTHAMRLGHSLNCHRETRAQPRIILHRQKTATPYARGALAPRSLSRGHAWRAH